MGCAARASLRAIFGLVVSTHSPAMLLQTRCGSPQVLQAPFTRDTKGLIADRVAAKFGGRGAPERARNAPPKKNKATPHLRRILILIFTLRSVRTAYQHPSRLNPVSFFFFLVLGQNSHSNP